MLSIKILIILGFSANSSRSWSAVASIHQRKQGTMEAMKEVPITSKTSFDHDENSSDNVIDVDGRESDEMLARKLRRRIDIRLLPVLTILYLFSYIDRSNSKSQAGS